MTAGLRALKNRLLQDWEANEGSAKARFITAFFRFAQLVGQGRQPWRFLGVPVLALYELLVIWLLKIEIRYPTKVGPGLCLAGCAVAVVHESSILGKNCRLGNCATIGAKEEAAAFPVIGDNVRIGPNSVVLGAVRIGDGAVIGPGCVVTRNVEEGETVSGNAGKFLG